MRYRSLRREDTISCWLSPVIHLEQGDSDSLCVYYSAAMLLLAFYPKYFGRIFASADADPILRHVKPVGPQSRQQMIANWLFDGIEPKRVVHALNRLSASEDLAFKVVLKERNKVATTFKDIKHDIDRGLPVLLCHKSQSLGHHAFVVDGYQIERRHSAHPIYWLSLCDPGGDNIRQWEQLTTLSSGRLEVLRVKAQDKLPRPDRCTTTTDRAGTIQKRTRERYWFHNGEWCWVEAEVLFEQAVSKAS